MRPAVTDAGVRVLREPPTRPVVRFGAGRVVAAVTRDHDPTAWARSGALDAASDVVVGDELTAARVSAAWAEGLTRLVGADELASDAAITALPMVGADGAERWGDLHLARALARSFRRRGYPTRILLRPDWGTVADVSCDLVVHLRGLTRRPIASRRQRNLLWIISHPERIEPGELDDYDWIASAGSGPVGVAADVLVHHVPQAADTDTFRPCRIDPRFSGAVLVAGNARQVRRRAPAWLHRHDVEFDLYGTGWHDRPEARHLVAEHVPNRELAGAYRSATVVVADHHATMRTGGFIANRLYDVAAAGGVVVSDPVVGVETVFGAAIPVYRDDDELVDLVRALGADTGRREALAAAARAVVEAGHRIDDRADQLIRIVNGVEPG